MKDTPPRIFDVPPGTPAASDLSVSTACGIPKNRYGNPITSNLNSFGSTGGERFMDNLADFVVAINEPGVPPSSNESEKSRSGTSADALYP